MKRAVIVALALIVATPTTPAFAAVKAGSACTKVGSTAVISGKKLTCIKSGSKLLWSSIKLVEPKTLAAAASNYSQVSYWSSIKSAATIKKSPAKRLFFSDMAGPNTQASYGTADVALGQVAKMFPNFDLTKEFVLIYYNFTDRIWAQDTLDAYVGQTAGYDISGVISQLCTSEKECEKTSTFLNKFTGTTVVMVPAADYKKGDIRFTSGILEAGEYFRVYQATQFAGSTKTLREVPSWLVEGSVAFVAQTAIGVTEPRLRAKLKESDLVKILNGTTTADTQLLTAVGLAASEIMVAVKGPESILQQFKYVAEGMSYSDAFAKVFGVSFAEGVKLIAKAIA